MNYHFLKTNNGHLNSIGYRVFWNSIGRKFVTSISQLLLWYTGTMVDIRWSIFSTVLLNVCESLLFSGFNKFWQHEVPCRVVQLGRLITHQSIVLAKTLVQHNMIRKFVCIAYCIVEFNYIRGTLTLISLIVASRTIQRETNQLKKFKLSRIIFLES